MVPDLEKSGLTLTVVGSVCSSSSECGDPGVGGQCGLCREDVPPGVSHVRLPAGRQHLLVDRRQTAHGRLTGGEDTGRLTERGDVRKGWTGVSAIDIARLLKIRKDPAAV